MLENQTRPILVYIPKEVILLEVRHRQALDSIPQITIKRCDKRQKEQNKVQLEQLPTGETLEKIYNLQEEGFKVLVG